MATEVLRPQDCLRPDSFYGGFSSLKQFSNRRRNRLVRPNQTASPSSKPKHSRPNPKPNRKSSSSSPSTSPPSTSPIQEGFRLLKRGETLRLDRSGSETEAPVEKTKLEKKHQPETPPPPPTKGVPVPLSRKSEPSIPSVEKTTPQKKSPLDRVRSELATLPTKPRRVGSGKDLSFAGPYYLMAAPAAESLPLPDFLKKSGSVGPTSDDEASRTLRGLLKLDFQ